MTRTSSLPFRRFGTTSAVNPQVDQSRDPASAVAVYGLVGWMVCQVFILLLLPWLQNTAWSDVRLLVLAPYLLTFRSSFRLGAHGDTVLVVSVVGFEQFLEWWCGLPLSFGWVVIVAVIAVGYLAPHAMRRLHAWLLRQSYALLRSGVYATTTTERLQDPHFCWLNRALAGALECLRRRCAYKLCALNA